MTSFTEKQLRATLTLPQGNFSGTNSNSLVLTNLRMSARLERAGNYTNTCSLQIWGMKQVDMNSVTVVFSGAGGTTTPVNARAILVLESNDGSGWLQVFEGQLQEAQPDYRQAPAVCLTLQATTGANWQWIKSSPSSFKGSTDAATIAEQLAQQMGFQFENNGVSAKFQSPYLSGTLMDQFKELASSAPFDYYFDAKSTLIVCPPNQARQNKTPIAVNGKSGMVSYPTLQRDGIQVQVLFTPAIEMGSPITISDSDVQGVDGTWFPYHAIDELDALKPGGKWFSTLDCGPSSNVPS